MVIKTGFSTHWVLSQPFSFIPGTLLHFEDHNLRNVYFLDPQWLAKLMADVIHPAAIGTAAHIPTGESKLRRMGHLVG